jgi:hypothetical protein
MNNPNINGLKKTWKKPMIVFIEILDTNGDVDGQVTDHELGVQS